LHQAEKAVFVFGTKSLKLTSMKLIFEQTPEHIKDLQKKVFLGGRLKIYLFVAITLILINIFNFTDSDAGSNSQDIETVNPLAEILSWIIPIVIIGLIWYFVFKKMVGRNSIQKNSPSSIGPRELDITEENIHYKTNEFTGTFNWSGLTDFKESNLCYFLHIGRMQAIIIPKSAFDSKAQETEFTTLVNKKLKED
jgi:heme/copper-type cytochrome/quinol oxidase subunit 2